MLQVLQPKLAHRNTQKIEDYIDLSNSVPSPYTLFVSVKDLENHETDTVHFFSYSMGKERFVVWGIFSRSESKIYFDSGCTYNSFIFTEYIKHWRSIGYEPVSTVAKNRFSKRIDKYLEKSSSHPLIYTREDYKAMSIFIGWFEGKYDGDTFMDLYDTLDIENLSMVNTDYNTLEELIDNYYEYVDRKLDKRVDLDDELYEIIKDNVSVYESRMNINDIITNIKVKKYSVELKVIADTFIKALERSIYARADTIKVLEECPTFNECEFEDRYDRSNKCSVFYQGVYDEDDLT